MPGTHVTVGISSLSECVYSTESGHKGTASFFSLNSLLIVNGSVYMNVTMLDEKKTVSLNRLPLTLLSEFAPWYSK